jgi:molecular chaperone GrpE (heat shock protein)
MAVHPFADVLYGENWRNELSKYKKQNERNEYIMTGSIVCTAMGGSVYAWWLLLWTARLVIRCSSGLKRSLPNALRTLKGAKNRKSGPADAKDLPREQKARKQHDQREKHSKVLAGSGRQKPAALKYDRDAMKPVAKKGKVPDKAEKIAVLLSDKKSAGFEVSTTKRGNERLEVRERSKPLNSAISELTQQVSAIREYAACQQDRLEKLQDGYDWNIIRAFCLRVIRCIDNLESRISQLNEEDIKATHLEEVRDELIFALESSGIEQFEPETNSEYRGQEKFAEAVKDKQCSDDAKHTGKIANVIRPGYQYFINEENTKVVRPAQVRLFA